MTPQQMNEQRLSTQVEQRYQQAASTVHRGDEK